MSGGRAFAEVARTCRPAASAHYDERGRDERAASRQRPRHVRVDCGSVRVRVEVGDDNALRPEVPDEDDYAEGGRGMLIAHALATEWGVQSMPTGKIV